jgi:hypothetical protein
MVAEGNAGWRNLRLVLKGRMSGMKLMLRA